VVTQLSDDRAGVALTFDDGPHPSGTPAVLAELAEAGAQATFFLVARQAVARPALVAEILAAGHEVACHGDRHLPHCLLPPPVVWRDLTYACDVIEQISGTEVGAVRSPFGAMSLATMAFCRRRGLDLTGWSRWGWDWRRGATAGSITGHVTRDVAAGDIVLLHDSDFYSAPGSWRATAAAVRPIVDAVRSRGLEPVKLAATYPPRIRHMS
jgi:peptidoglycan-N-acetylglucosamine deacetylase